MVRGYKSTTTKNFCKPLIIREINIKTRVKFCLTHIRLAKISEKEK